MQTIRQVSATHTVVLRDGKPIGKAMYYWHSDRWLVHWANKPNPKRGQTYNVDTARSYRSLVDAIEAIGRGYHHCSVRTSC